ncbi:MAG: holo-ACP synthase [Deferribacteraceae bacterium]|jgi:holo-[acyl-carrier protein] synthase|nr:holo-ACP synthase [Deferribacteraceae bacterium]
MLGCDIADIRRINRSYERHGAAFLNKILTQAEQDIFFKRGESITFLAGRFAAKEALSKALGTGIGRLAFTDIEVLPNEFGQPALTVRGYNFSKCELSISHSKGYAVAVCILEY